MATMDFMPNSEISRAMLKGLDDHLRSKIKARITALVQPDIDAAVEGEGGDMAFNSRFLQELLSNFPSDEVVFEMTGALNPGVFRSAKHEGYLHIIMPVRVASG